MSGGPAEIALLKAVATGAATGAATSAITGGDPLKGALVGSFMNGVGGAFGGGAAGAGAGASGAAGAGASGAAGAGASGAAGAGAGATTGASALEAARASTTLGGTAPGFKLPSGAAEQLIPMPSGVPDMAASMAPTAGAGVGGAAPPPGVLDKAMNWYSGLSTPQKIGVGVGGGLLLSGLTSPQGIPDTEEYRGPLKYFKYDPRKYRAAYADGGGITDLDIGNTSRMPSNPVIMMRSGGISDLGDYSDGGRLLKGPGDGVSDSIPARIGQKREARLADGEFVVPARIVSELGNGSTDAGARQLYAMMDRIQARRRKTVGKGRTAVDSKASKLLPA